MACACARGTATPRRKPDGSERVHYAAQHEQSAALKSKSKGAALKSKSKGAALKSKSKDAVLKSKSKGAVLKSKSKFAVCATNRRARNVSVANEKFLSAPPRARPRNSGDKARSIKPSPRSRRGSRRSIRSVQLKVREKARDLGTSMPNALRHR